MTGGVSECVGMLQSAVNDTEKFAALLMVTKLVKAEQCSAEDKCHLFAAIGFDYIVKMITSSTPAECPADILKSIGLTILACFAQEPSIGGSREMADIVPVIASLAASNNNNSSTVDSDDDHIVDNDAAGSSVSTVDVVCCLQCALASESGRRALCQSSVLRVLVDAAVSQSTPLALHVLHELCEQCSDMWQRPLSANNDNNEDEQRATLYDRLVDSLVERLQYDSDADSQLTECRPLAALLLCAPPSATSGGGLRKQHGAWWPRLCSALSRLLVARLTTQRRGAVLALAAAAVHVLNTCATCHVPRVDEQNDEQEQDALVPADTHKQLAIVTVNLFCIEIRMCMEERGLAEVMEVASLMCSAFMVLESITCVLVSEQSPLALDNRQQQQLIGAVRGATSAVAKFIAAVMDSDIGELPDEQGNFIKAAVKLLIVWLAEDNVYPDEVISIVPYLLSVCTRGWHLPSLSNGTATVKAEDTVGTLDLAPGVKPSSDTGSSEVVDLLRLFLPALCHLTADDSSRSVLLQQAQVDCVLIEFVQSRWRRSFDTVDGGELDAGAADAAQAVTTACSSLLNIVVMAPERVHAPPPTAIAFNQLLRWLLRRKLAAFTAHGSAQRDTTADLTVLHANLLVLALLLTHRLDQSPTDSPASSALAGLDQSQLLRLLQTAVRFLWDAYSAPCVEQSGTHRGPLAVSSRYRGVWSQLSELWQLGMQAVGRLAGQHGWICEFIVDSGWPDTLVSMLARVRPAASSHDDSQHESGAALHTFETFLVALCETSGAARRAVATSGGQQVSRTLRFRHLARLLRQ